MNEEFKEYFKLNYAGYYSNGAPKTCDFTDCEIEDAYKAGYEAMQTKLDEQAKELEALRETYRYLIAEQSTRVMSDALITHILRQGGIIDENGNPTPLLTGDK